MNKEQFSKACDLNKSIRDCEKDLENLDMIKKSGKCSKSLKICNEPEYASLLKYEVNIPKEALQPILSLVKESIEKKLQQLRKEFEAL